MAEFITDFVDENIPIIISLQYKHNYLKFPVNPNELTKDRPSQSEKARVEGIGEISNPTTTGLATINISSFFWQDVNMVPTSFYVDWLEKWQDSKLPAKLVVTRFNYSMYVTCENFRHTKKAGEEKDVYFELQLQEYRPHGAKKLNVKPKFDLFGSSISLGKKASASILFDIPRPERYNNKPEFENPYKTKKGDSIISITKTITGETSDWKKLYDENKETLGNLMASGDGEIPIGTELKIPNDWIK